MGTAHVPRVRTALLRTFDRLDCAANAKINLRCIDVLYIFATSGGVHMML